MSTEVINGLLIVRNKLIPPSSFKLLNLVGVVFTHLHTVLTAANIRHEYTHSLQQWETLIVGFYVIYVMQWIVNLVYYGDAKKAYKCICFELEANMSENDENYNNERKHFAWWKYFKYSFKYDELYS